MQKQQKTNDLETLPLDVANVLGVLRQTTSYLLNKCQELDQVKLENQRLSDALRRLQANHQRFERLKNEIQFLSKALDKSEAEQRRIDRTIDSLKNENVQLRQALRHSYTDQQAVDNLKAENARLCRAVRSSTVAQQKHERLQSEILELRHALWKLTGVLHRPMTERQRSEHVKSQVCELQRPLQDSHGQKKRLEAVRREAETERAQKSPPDQHTLHFLHLRNQKLLERLRKSTAESTVSAAAVTGVQDFREALQKSEADFDLLWKATVPEVPEGLNL